MDNEIKLQVTIKLNPNDPRFISERAARETVARCLNANLGYPQIQNVLIDDRP